MLPTILMWHFLATWFFQIHFTILAFNIALSKPLFSIMSMNIINYIEIVESFFYFILKKAK